MGKIIVGSAGIIESDNKFLIIQRYEPELVEFHGNFELPGGKIKYGENPNVAVVREVLEETGYHVKYTNTIPYIASNIVKYSDYEIHIIVSYHHCMLSSKGRLENHVPDKKVSKVCWLSYDEIESMKTTPGTIEAISIYSVHKRFNKLLMGGYSDG